VLAEGGTQISSTRLRKELNEKEGKELVEELETMALTQRLLVNVIQAYQVKVEEKEMAKLKGHSKLQGLISSK
jgi:hypothetical protein